MGFMYQRSGLISFGLFTLAFLAAAAAASTSLSDEAKRSLVGLIAALGGPFGIAFLVKLYAEAHSDVGTTRWWLLLHAAGGFAIATVVWVVIIAFMHPSSHFLAKLGNGQALWFVAENLAAGAFFDALEVYRIIEPSKLDYAADDLVAATTVFGLRLTGSGIVAALFIRAIAVRPSLSG